MTPFYRRRLAFDLGSIGVNRQLLMGQILLLLPIHRIFYVLLLCSMTMCFFYVLCTSAMSSMFYVVKGD
jgi:hypothetical protein